MLRAFQWDLARQVERLDWLLDQLPRYAEWGYHELYLHLEDAVDYPSLPGVARADAYRWRDFERLVERATACGLQVVPIANLLGHTQYVIKTEQWRDLNELRGPDGRALERGQVCPLHPRTPELTARLLDDLTPFCTAGKIHVGLDESFHLGQHPLSRAEVAEVGRATHFARYVHRLNDAAQQRGLRLGIWADMLTFLPDAIPQLPRGIIAYDWYYHAFRRHPRVELFNFAEVDLAPALLSQGIEYWGCPMNGAFRFEPLPVFGERLANAQSWWRRCHAVGAGGFLVTSWEAYRLAIELTTVVDAAIASLWLDSQLDDHSSMLTKGFERVLGREGARSAARTALACDSTAFAGYARWEVNHRWSVTTTHESARAFEREGRLHARLALREGLPPPLAASIAFREYLAERDAFIRRAAKAVFALRRAAAADPFRSRPRRPSRHSVQPVPSLRALAEEATAFSRTLQAGRRAASAMWRRTRSFPARSQNHEILAADRIRLKAWRAWLERSAREPQHVWTASPMAGVWQLQLIVINVAPAQQRVVVEQQSTGDEWRELVGRHTIEFRTAAARPRANVRRSLVVPLETPDRPLRLRVRGGGEVRITHVELTNGVVTKTPAGWKRSERRRLGSAAPRAGWPEPAYPDPGFMALQFAVE